MTAWGMQVLTLPPEWDGYPEHKHDAEAFDPNQEEVYIPIEGSATLVADGESSSFDPARWHGLDRRKCAASFPARMASGSLRSAASRRVRGGRVDRDRG